MMNGKVVNSTITQSDLQHLSLSGILKSIERLVLTTILCFSQNDNKKYIILIIDQVNLPVRAMLTLDNAAPFFVEAASTLVFVCPVCTGLPFPLLPVACDTLALFGPRVVAVSAVVLPLTIMYDSSSPIENVVPETVSTSPG